MEKLTQIKYHDIIDCLVGALEAKDQYVSGHSTRVADMSYELAVKIGVEGKELEDIHIAAHLHDIGKIGIPDTVLHKPSRLSEEEWSLIKTHPRIGFAILNRSEVLRDIAEIVLHHHERWDGKGYGEGLAREQIPRGSRIIAICDSIDAMCSDRSYRSAMSWSECREEIEGNKGRQFDPFLVDAIGGLWDQWNSMYFS